MKQGWHLCRPALVWDVYCSISTLSAKHGQYFNNYRQSFRLGSHAAEGSWISAKTRNQQCNQSKYVLRIMSKYFYCLPSVFLKFPKRCWKRGRILKRRMHWLGWGSSNNWRINLWNASENGTIYVFGFSNGDYTRNEKLTHSMTRSCYKKFSINFFRFSCYDHSTSQICKIKFFCFFKTLVTWKCKHVPGNANNVVNIETTCRLPRCLISE